MKNYTIICVDLDIKEDTPVIVQNYGLMTKEQAQAKLMEIYESEKDYVKSLDMQDTIVEWTGVYVGVLFDNNYESDLNRKEYYLQELEVK